MQAGIDCLDCCNHHKENDLGLFPFVRTGQPDHYQTSYFDNEIGFLQGFLLLPAHYLGFDWSSWIVLINSEILITKGRVWPVSQSDKWKMPLKSAVIISIIYCVMREAQKIMLYQLSWWHKVASETLNKPCCWSEHRETCWQQQTRVNNLSVS